MGFSRRTFLGALSAAGVLSRTKAASPPPTDDPLGVRGDFPVVEHGIYLNAPYITPSPRQVVGAVERFYRAKAEAPVSLGAMLEETNEARRRFGRLVNASEPEVGMLFATSEGENIVAGALGLGEGDNVVIDDLHYETTFVLYRHLAETRGVELRIVESRDGQAGVDAFAPHVDSRTRLVSVAWVSHQNGYCHDLTALADLAHSHGAYLYADAIQGVGMLSLDVRETGIDFFTSGTYKWLLGGYGVAPFFVRQGLLDTVKLDRMGSLHIAQELPHHRFELYKDARKYGYATLAFAAVYQLNAALEYLLRVGVDRIEAHSVPLAHRIRSGLVDLGYEVWTPPGNRSAIVTFAHGRDFQKVKAKLESEGIQVSFKDNNRLIRVGASLFNNSAETEQFLKVMGQLM